MPSLSKELRRLLEKTIAGENGARQIAELGAEQSLRRFAVDRHEPHASLTSEERILRTQLRAHGRQLGDKRDLQRGSQSIGHLAQAVAYEHWHRLLFARFLAENDLLMHPDHKIALSLNEVKEVALGLGRDWIDVASEYAQRMLLREVFRPDDPALKVPLSPERRLELEKKLNLLPREIFLADDSLGWVYQFWQKDAKDQVNRSEVKIGADEMSPVTQLFTEDYMVLFLLENTLGAWWTARRSQPHLTGHQWTYLRLNDDGSPVAGGFQTWPKTSKELKVLDPCMGSGHFLTFALPMLARMRCEEESLSFSESIYAALRDNIFGLELDLRCSQIAAFNLALTAWKLNGGHFELPPLNIACSGLSINAKEEDWVELAGNDGLAGEAMRKLYSLFSDAPTLGSLIDPLQLKASVYATGIESVLPLLEAALQNEEADEDERELAIAAKGMVSAFNILAGRFTLVATNVPYLGRGKQGPLLASYSSEFHKNAKADLATCFVERCLRFCDSGGSSALVTPQNWLFLTSYTKLRESLLGTAQWDFVCRLGSNAFETISGEVVNVALIGITRRPPDSLHIVAGLDVSVETSSSGKKQLLRTGQLLSTLQTNQLGSPDARIVFEAPSSLPRLSERVASLVGIQTGDYPRFVRKFWEIPQVSQEWELYSRPADDGMDLERSEILLWESGRGSLLALVQEKLGVGGEGAWLRGGEAWGRKGVAIQLMKGVRAWLYEGQKYDQTLAVLIPKNPEDLPALFAYASSTEYVSAVRSLDQKLNLTNLTLTKVPFDLEFWQRVAEEQFPNGLPAPSSEDPTQWLFSGHPQQSTRLLHVSIARLLGYSWPHQAVTGDGQLEPAGSDAVRPSDGIVCLAALAGEESAATRIKAFLQSTTADDRSLSELLSSTKSKSLEMWLRDEFFEEHCKLFHQVPFIWHIWDGLKDGFHALINYHRLDRQSLEKLIYSYLGDWLTRQRQELQRGVEGSDTKLAAAEHLQQELIKILIGDQPYDIFARWKPIDEQPIGWEPDLNDGVRVNIRPWIEHSKLYKSVKPGILRALPKIKYGKDRGQEPTRDPKHFPWCKDSTDRINDHHLSLTEKRNARGLK